MATNKNAQIRYQALDRCLSNWSRRYYIDDLVDACNDALYLYNGEGTKGDGVRKRQVQEDLKFMQSEEGYRMTIDAIVTTIAMILSASDLLTKRNRIS